MWRIRTVEHLLLRSRNIRRWCEVPSNCQSAWLTSQTRRTGASAGQGAHDLDRNACHVIGDKTREISSSRFGNGQRGYCTASALPCHVSGCTLSHAQDLCAVLCCIGDDEQQRRAQTVRGNGVVFCEARKRERRRRRQSKREEQQGGSSTGENLSPLLPPPRPYLPPSRGL